MSTTDATLFSRAFDELAVGDSHTSQRRLITAADVDVFAALTGDRHPVHLDDGWAAASPFGGRVAHGLLVLSAAAGALPLDPERVIALRRVRDAVFKAPLAIGEGIRVRCEVAGKRELDAATGLVACAWRITGDDGSLRARANVDVLWSRDAAGGPAGARGRHSPLPAREQAPVPPEPDLSPVLATDDGLRVLI